LDYVTSSYTAGCGICIGETFFAFQMANQGKTPSEVRAANIRGDWKKADVKISDLN